MISSIPSRADSLQPHSRRMYHGTAASHEGSVQTSEYSFQSRAAIPRPPSFRHRFERPSASVARSLYEVDSQWESRSNLDISQRPVTSSSKKSFPRTAKRKLSRDAIASDSDARNIQALSDFLRTREPPPSSFTSIPEEKASRGSFIFGMFGSRSRRNSTSTRSLRSVKNSKSLKSMKNLIQLPDSAVAMKTKKGGHWHIAICVPGVNDVPPLPRFEDIQNPQVKDLLSRAHTPELTSLGPALMNESRSQRSIRTSLEGSLSEEPNFGHAQALRISSVRNTSATTKPAEPDQPLQLTAKIFESQKFEIAAAIASWQKESSDSDLPAFLHRLAAMASLEGSALNSRKGSISASTVSVSADPEMDLWCNRQMSMDSEISQDVATLRTVKPRSVSPKASDRTVKMELPRVGTNTWRIGELRPSSRENAPPVRSRRGSIETLRTLRKEQVSALRQRDLLASKESTSRGRSQEQVSEYNALESMRALDSSRSQNLPPKLWQPSPPAKVSAPPTLWQPTPPPSVVRQQSKSKPSESQKMDEPASITDQQQTAITFAPRSQDTEQIMEITKALMQLQQQNAMMMQTLVAVTNMGSSYHDMKLLAEPGSRGSVV
ncbi:hypothetical protein V8E51_017750 [Hyaloscypha variabilis]